MSTNEPTLATPFLQRENIMAVSSDELARNLEAISSDIEKLKATVAAQAASNERIAELLRRQRRVEMTGPPNPAAAVLLTLGIGIVIGIVIRR